MKASETNLKTLLITLHQKIEENANFTATKLNNTEHNDLLNYPPNFGLTIEERQALNKLSDDQHLKSALRKVLADNSASVVFELLNFIDGTTDPDTDNGEWSELAFVDKSDSIDPPEEMLHDEFFATYWDWQKLRPSEEWKLDTHEG